MSQDEIDKKFQGYVDTLPGKERLNILDKKRARSPPQDDQSLSHYVR